MSGADRIYDLPDGWRGQLQRRLKRHKCAAVIEASFIGVFLISLIDPGASFPLLNAVLVAAYPLMLVNDCRKAIFLKLILSCADEQAALTGRNPDRAVRIRLRGAEL